MQEILPGIFMKALALRGNPLKSINIFIVKTPEKNMIVDTGFHTKEVKEDMKAYLEELEIDLEKTVLFLTHLHSDHIGLAADFADAGIQEIFFSRVDGQIADPSAGIHAPQWQGILHQEHLQDLKLEGLSITDHPGFKNRPQKSFPYTPVDPGDIIEIGEFCFEVIDEAGHTPGMVGLYDANKKVLFCGDHILGSITPNITYWGEEYGDSLGTYLKNLEALKDLEIEHLLSSHRALVEDMPARIDELQAHHDERLAETLSILEELGSATVREVTSRLSWDIRAKSWADFPAAQKWFAAGEAHAHLKHLLALGKVQESYRPDGVVVYEAGQK